MKLTRIGLELTPTKRFQKAENVWPVAIVRCTPSSDSTTALCPELGCRPNQELVEQRH